jgi:hypothetical protein
MPGGWFQSWIRSECMASYKRNSTSGGIIAGAGASREFPFVGGFGREGRGPSTAWDLRVASSHFAQGQGCGDRREGNSLPVEKQVPLPLRGFGMTSLIMLNRL